MQYFRTLTSTPSQDMYQFANTLRHQLHEQSLNIMHRRKIVEKNNELQLQQAQKECSQAEKLLEDQVEVGQSTQVQSTETDVFKLMV